jgi:hypothetical protein
MYELLILSMMDEDKETIFQIQITCTFLFLDFIQIIKLITGNQNDPCFPFL